MSGRTLTPEDLDRPDWNSLKNNYDKHDVGEAYLRGRVEQMGLHVEDWGIDMRHHDDSLIFDNKMDLRLWEPVDGQEHPPDYWPSDSIDYDDQPLAYYEVAHADSPGTIEAARSHPNITEADIQAQFDIVEWECRGIIDVKTKANEDWLGVTNMRHLAHYAQWANRHSELGVPVAIYFTMVDMDEEKVGTRNIFIPITTDWPWEELVAYYDHNEDVSWPRRREIAEQFGATKETFTAPDGNDVVRFHEDAWHNFDWFVSEVL